MKMCWTFLSEQIRSFTIHMFSIFLTLGSVAEGALNWHVDYDTVKTLSLEEKKPILLFFNGSDWSGEAMWLKREVLDTPTFENKIASRFLCIEIDFPEHSSLSEAKMAQNLTLKDRFQIEETPTLLIIDSNERVITQIGYLPENGGQFADELIGALDQDVQLIRGLANLSSASSPDLKKLYEIAQELGRRNEEEAILNAGIKAEDLYFFLEKYRLLVERGEKNTEATQSFREKICAFDPHNEKRVHFTLALIDFQELSQKNKNPDAAVEPLLTYLEKFESIDCDNVWRIEMMIAQHYMEADLNQKALLHAEKALQTAPKTKFEEISHSLNYIRSHTVR